MLLCLIRMGLRRLFHRPGQGEAQAEQCGIRNSPATVAGLSEPGRRTLQAEPVNPAPAPRYHIG